MKNTLFQKKAAKVTPRAPFLANFSPLLLPLGDQSACHALALTVFSPLWSLFTSISLPSGAPDLPKERLGSIWEAFWEHFGPISVTSSDDSCDARPGPRESQASPVFPGYCAVAGVECYCFYINNYCWHLSTATMWFRCGVATLLCVKHQFLPWFVTLVGTPLHMYKFLRWFQHVKTFVCFRCFMARP